MSQEKDRSRPQMNILPMQSFAYEEMGSFKITGSITDTGGTFVFHSLGVVCSGHGDGEEEYRGLNDRLLRFDWLRE